MLPLLQEQQQPRLRSRKDFMAWWGNKAADLIEPSDPTEADFREAARRNLIDFIQYTFRAYKTDPFHRHVASNIQKIVTGDATHLMLFAPPQHGKSTIVSTHLPPFWLAHNPELPVALVSYAASLADRNSRLAQTVMVSESYHDRLFPWIPIDQKNWRVRDWHLKGHTGFVAPFGVGGPITGHGFGLVIIDDPIENWAAAQSELLREKAWDWYQGTLLTRLWEGARQVLMMTRWHKDDLAGRILKDQGRVEEGGKWLVLEYPALATAEEPKDDPIGRSMGEALAPSRFSQEWLEAQRDSVGRMVWLAEYQQTPVDPEGDFFKVGRFSIEDTPPADICTVGKGPDGQPVLIELQGGVRYWDLAATEKSISARDPDYVSGTLMDESAQDRRFWIMDQKRARLRPEQVEDLVRLTAKLDGKKVKIRIEQEPGASGKMLVAAFVRMLAGWDVKGVPVSGQKTVRAQGYAAQVNAGNVVLFKAPWNSAFIEEHAGFPNVAHDDQVDTASGAFTEIVSAEDRLKKIKFMRA